MSHREKSPSDLIFEALCLRFRSTTNIGKTMTRQELQEDSRPCQAATFPEQLQAAVE